MKTAGIIGAAGYAARELIGLLVRHPEIALTDLVSESQAGKSAAHFHKDFEIPGDLAFSQVLSGSPDVLFLCGGHGASEKYLNQSAVGDDTVIIDLSMDFRTHENFVYGLPELHKGCVNKRIANPGCFATAIQLGMLPMLGVQDSDWHVTAITGSSGAGQALQETSHFSWRENNVSSYKVFEHQHLVEINHHGKKCAAKQGKNPMPKLHFIPLRGPFTRGIFATLYCETTLSDSEVKQLYKTYYNDATFTKVVATEPDLKQVTGTNYCLIFPRVIDGKLVITTVIDNLLKGAAGQAVENMNTVFGFAPETGLNLKPAYL